MNTTRLLGWVWVAMLGGCSAGAQVVRQDARGGDLVLWGPVVPASEEARTQMAGRCRGRFAVTAEVERRDGDARHVTYVCEGPAVLRDASLARLEVGARVPAAAR